MTKRLVVIGSSWGGVDALRIVLSALDPALPLAVAVVQHRSADVVPGALVSRLARATRLAVAETDDKEPIEPGRVYLAPADYHLLVEPGHFALSTEGRVHHSRPSVDVLFESAATAYGSAVVGVVLTGANRDGAVGVRRIRARGGLTIAQDPLTAERPEMPEAAIATGAVQHILPLDEIAKTLVAAAEPSS